VRLGAGGVETERTMAIEQHRDEDNPGAGDSPSDRSGVTEVTPADPTEAGDFHIVGIGASAGGLESLERLFTHLPTDTGMAFVVLQHLSPDFKSLMDELLARRTEMRIRQAEHDILLEPNTVYLLPPMKEMIIRRRRLLLNDRDPRSGLTLPIDLFLRSLAHDVGDRAVAVILSGSGSDGSRGVKEIRRAGGTVFCETPDSAQFNGMPLSAMRTGDVDQVLPPEEIALAIAALGRPPSEETTESPSEEEQGVEAILRLLRDEYGIDFSHYKASTVTRRIERRLALNRSIDIDMYVEQLRADTRELSSLYEDLLIGVTRFFRDDDAFQALEGRVIPELIERSGRDEQIRVWVPGCATGQEAYSIAILLHEQLAARRRPMNVKILATDVHKASLEVASAGVYSEEQVAGIGQERLQRFFTLKANGYQVSQTLRESIVFAPHNLIRDAPFTKMDLIACRNLLIYFQPHAQKTVLTLFHFSLKPGGFLFLGSSESPGGLVDEFDAVDEHAKIYRKRRDVALPRDLKLPLPRSASAPRVFQPQLQRSSGVSQQLLAIYDRLLDRFMPPSFLVDEQGQLVDAFGGVESLLKMKPRRPSQNLLDMIGDDLRAAISGALHRVRRDVESVRYPVVVLPEEHRRFSLVAEPIRDKHGTPTHILISLADADSTRATALVPPFADVQGPRTEVDSAGDYGLTATVGVSADRITALEEELAYTKDHLQAAVQEHEAANEELQATNEELVAANEELQSTNEELHSVNEEMYTVNAEYQKKNLELQELNDDIEHLLNTTEVATMFLDRQLCIRKFTPSIAETFRVIPQDVGRPIRTFTHDLAYPTLFADMERVLHDGITVEMQTTDKQHRSLFLRILPYRARRRDTADPLAPRGTTEPAYGPDGVVLTLTDISALEQARAKLAQLSAIVESSDDAIIGKTLDGIITTWNRGAAQLYGYAAEETIGRHASFLYPPGRKDEIDNVLRQVRSGQPVERLETLRLRKDGSVVDVSVTFSPIRDAANTIVGISGISRDITQIVRAREEIAEREERIRLLLDSTAEAIYGIDLSGVCTFCNRACARLLGYDSPAALIGKQMHPLIHHSRADGTPYAPEQSPIFEAMRHREGSHVDDEVLWRADGTSFPAEYWSHPIFRGEEVIGAVVTFLDVTERRRAEQEIQDGVRRREQFLAMLSHELRNPLSAILSATRILDSASWTDQACHEAGQVVARQANHMARLLDDLLDVARITRGRIALRSELVDLRDSARSAIEALAPFMAERDTRLSVEIDPDPIPVFGDATRLQQIQANLLSNASKYSPRGARVRFELRRDREHAVIRVADEGRGIEPHMLPRIFDLFVQGEQTLARSEGGLGIGLTLLRSLVQLHDGSVDAHSDGPGRGSTFTVRLPLAAPDAAAEAADRHAPAPVRTVVIVEDQADARRMMQFLLEAEGVQVFTAENGLDGAALIERIRPDLALVDLGLPVMSGYDLARRIREMPEHARTRLVALSGYGQDSDVQASLDAGFDEHVTKPPDPARLEQLLRGRRPAP
jgi:two-component system CheB/CheR fusion protein